MSYLAQGGGICPALLVGLGFFLGAGDPQTKQTEAGVLKALFDSSNDFPGVKQFDKGNGHYSNVRYEWKKRGTESDGLNQFGKFDCDITGDVVDRQEDEFTINTDQPLGRPFEVDADALRNLCEEVTAPVNMPLIVDSGLAPQVIAGQVQQAVRSGQISSTGISVIQEVMTDFLGRMNGIRMGVNNNVADLLIAQVGEYVDGSSTKNFPLLKSTDDALNNKGFNALTREYVDAELAENGKPILIGFGKLFDAMQTKKVAIGNDLGIDLSRVGDDMIYYRDHFLGNKIGSADDFIMFAPGTAQLGVYNQNRGTYAGTHANVHKGVFPDLELGINNSGRYNLSYDVFVRELCDSAGADKYLIYMSVAYDLFTQPIAAYQNGAYDRLSGTNGIFQGTVTAV